MFGVEKSNLENNRDNILPTIFDGIGKIYTKQTIPPTHFHELFTLAYVWCMTSSDNPNRAPRAKAKMRERNYAYHKEAVAELYERLKVFLKNITESCLTVSKESLMEADGLSVYLKAWKDFQENSNCVNGVFAHYSRYQCEKNFYDHAMLTWRECLKQRDLYKSMMLASLKLVNQERRGETIEKQVVIAVKDCIADLDKMEALDEASIKYMEVFKDLYFEDLKILYCQKISELKSCEFDVTEYTKKKEQWANEEQTRAVMYLDETSDTQDRLAKVFQEELNGNLMVEAQKL